MTTKALIQENNSRKNLEVIENYLCADEDDRAVMPLTPKQKELLERWQFADDLICKDRYKHSDIVDQLVKKFGIQQSSAWDDIRNAQIVFAAGNAIHKRHGMYRQIRRLERFIMVNEQAGNWKTIENLEKVLQKAYDALPDAQAPKSARQIIFNIQNNKNTFNTSPDSIADALKVAEEYIDCEPVQEEEEPEAGAP